MDFKVLDKNGVKWSTIRALTRAGQVQTFSSRFKLFEIEKFQVAISFKGKSGNVRFVNGNFHFFKRLQLFNNLIFITALTEDILLLMVVFCN